ncbi:ExbD/TolR family protein [Pelobacter seleniigenes]|uniref:ExbD/TolR family protein n=1 Tax=Pelobacter seleniigenes TaxID=407188 RepID=UPI0004A6F0CB|nr:biopolymer transporter ExbD [Pelobacter seleniigenes]
MRESRRIRRMERNRKKVTGLNLTSLMDVFTILVFFLLANSSSSEILSTPKQIKLPDSVVETKPRETVVILVGPETILVQGEPAITTADLLSLKSDAIPEITERLNQLERNIIGVSTREMVENKEVTILADKSIPFRVLKKVMSTCTASGYGRISLAVIQKASQT